ncbi:MAG: ribosome-binding factor A [Elusimicrobiota bacterium]
MNWRSEKLKSMFLNEINLAISNMEELKEIGLFTLTDLEVAERGKTIYVFFSVFDEDEGIREKKVEKFMDIFSSISPEIKEIIRKRIRTRFIPNIIFKFDPTPLKAMKIEEILKNIKAESDKNNSI